MSLTRLCLGVFLSSLETTIIATALVTISSDFGHFDKSSWIVVAYLLTYTGNGHAIYAFGTKLIANRFNDYIHKDE
jgi:MFS family permease